MAYGLAQSMNSGGFVDPRDKLMQKLGYTLPKPVAPPIQPDAMGQPAASATALPPAPRLATATPNAAPAPAQAAPQGYIPPIARDRVQQEGAGDGQQPYWQGLDEAQRRELTEYINLLYSMPDFKGRHEQNQGLIAIKANEIRNRKKNAGLPDYYGTAKIGDQFDSLQDQLMAQLSARGIGGSGIEAGALSRLAGLEGQAVGQYVSAQDEAARDRAERERLETQRLLYQILLGNAQRNNEEQNDPGFWGDVLGIGGSVLGSIL